MSSFNLNWIGGENWFQKPPNPLPLFNFKTPKKTHLKRTPKPLNFACVSIGKPVEKPPPPPAEDGSDRYERMLDYYFWECERLPDYRRSAKVEEILSRPPEVNLTLEEIENPDSPISEFLRQARAFSDELNAKAVAMNQKPYRQEDEELWKKLPHVPGPDGRPMPRMSIKTKQQADDKFWDFARQFFFGMWGFRQRPYPPGRPSDVAQAIGYKRLEKRYYDFTMKSTGWWYKDRLGRSRGPCELITLKTAWGAGIIDTDTFVWGEDMDEWAPIGMIFGLQKAIATWEVQLGATATAFIHKLTKGIPPWVPLKGHEKKTYKQLQEEAIESKRRDLAVLEANGGFWPGVRAPSHALFLWASGSDLTPTLEADHMPNKFIPKDLRERLQEVIPGLRPWEVLSIEQAMDTITYNGEWYREPLASYTTGPPYIRHWNLTRVNFLEAFGIVCRKLFKKVVQKISGLDAVTDHCHKKWLEMQERVQRKKAERELAEYIRLGYWGKLEVLRRRPDNDDK